ncbi:MAG TPA: hypothetical protein VGM90_35520 [Kofleriaceae bacterium]|jgi:hypothetical protein
MSGATRGRGLRSRYPPCASSRSNRPPRSRRRAGRCTTGSGSSLIGIWEQLDGARIPLDNNASERSILGPVVGPKNHYGSKSRSGTEVASRLYTILETCKLHDIDPAAYLHAAIIAADRGELLLPWSFASAAK